MQAFAGGELASFQLLFCMKHRFAICQNNAGVASQPGVELSFLNTFVEEICLNFEGLWKPTSKVETGDETLCAWALDEELGAPCRQADASIYSHVEGVSTSGHCD